MTRLPTWCRPATFSCSGTTVTTARTAALRPSMVDSVVPYRSRISEGARSSSLSPSMDPLRGTHSPGPPRSELTELAHRSGRRGRAKALQNSARSIGLTHKGTFRPTFFLPNLRHSFSPRFRERFLCPFAYVNILYRLCCRRLLTVETHNRPFNALSRATETCHSFRLAPDRPFKCHLHQPEFTVRSQASAITAFMPLGPSTNG